MPIKLGIVPVTPFEQNCSILVCQETGEAAVVDPGGDIEKILEGVKQMGGKVKKILLTHGHLDHCAAAKDLADQLSVPMRAHKKTNVFGLTNYQSKRCVLDLGTLKFLSLTAG
jgi:hydroxyacylglutathione hydrolase